MTKVSIKHLNNEHSDWLRSLDFYKEQIATLKDRLTEIGGKNTSKEMAVHLERFENQFCIQHTNIDQLSHDIRQYLHEASTQAEAHNGYMNSDLMSRHEALRGQFIGEEQTIHALRHEFHRFATHWM